MQIVYCFFPEIISDNEETYFASLCGVIEAIDELAKLEITKNPKAYNFRLIPSLPKYVNMLIEEILKFHNLLHLQLDMSKSIKSTSTIIFKLNLQ